MHRYFAWDSIGRIRNEIFAFLVKIPGDFVLTNCLYESQGDRNLYEQVKSMAEKRNSVFIPVRLLINKQEHIKRLTRPERKKRWKSIDPQYAEDNVPLLSIVHPNFLELEISNLSAQEAANKIMDHIEHIIE